MNTIIEHQQTGGIYLTIVAGKRKYFYFHHVILKSSMHVKTSIAFFFFVVSILGCKKENASQNEGTRLKRRVTSSTLFGGNIDSFFYDGQSRLIETRTLSDQSYDTRIEYNAAGQIAKVIYSFQGVDRYYYTFIRNSVGQIIHKAATLIGNDLACDQKFSYNSLGQIVSDTTYYKQTDSILYYSSYKYDTNQNIVEGEFVDLVNTTNRGKTVYNFDSNPNPLYLQGSLNYFVTNNPSYLNPNNIIEMRFWWSPPIKSQLTYQNNKLPSQIITDYSSSPFGPYTVTTKFEYW